MAKNILKEAIADAKAVREVALANAKSALEEAFTPKLQSMLSAKLSEELDDELGVEKDLDELVSYNTDEDSVTDIQTYDIDEEGMYEDDEIDLDEILNELGLDDGSEMEEGYQQKTYAQANDVQNVTYKAGNIQEGCTNCNESKDFDLDKLLEELNDLDEEIDLTIDDDELEEQFGNVNPVTGRAPGAGSVQNKAKGFEYWQNHPEILAQRLGMDPAAVPEHLAFWAAELEAQGCDLDMETGGQDIPDPSPVRRESYTKRLRATQFNFNKANNELSETRETLVKVRRELNEVNVLNSKLLYVNRIFKANNLSDEQKLRVVENIDKAGTVKEAKLIYETIKNAFNSKSTKSGYKRKSIKEGLGMASRSAGISTAPRKIISESNNMVARFQKLANISI